MDRKKVAVELLRIAYVLLKMPQTAKDWHLYAMAGADRVAMYLNKALLHTEAMFKEEAKKLSPDDQYFKRSLENVITDILEKYMEPTMNKYEDHGAADIAARNVALQHIKNLAEEQFKMEVNVIF